MPLPTFSSFEPATLLSRRDVAIDQIVVELGASERAVAQHTRAGQFLKARVDDADGNTLEGIFAMLSAPRERSLRFLLRKNNAEGGEAADRLALIPEGSPLSISDPAGDGFALERALGRDVVVIATGTAIAPARAAIEVMLEERGRYGAITLDYGVRSEGHVAIGDDLARWRDAGIEIGIHVSELDASGKLVGVRAQDVALARIRDASRTTVVAVGQSALVKELRATFASRGGDPERVLHNY